jgi:predicted HTH transcriptional regulator
MQIDEVSFMNRLLSPNGANGTDFGTVGTELLKLIRENPEATQKQYAEQMQLSRRTILRLFAELQERGILERKGSSRKGRWIINQTCERGKAL